MVGFFVDSHVKGFCDSCHEKIGYPPCAIAFGRPIVYDGFDRASNITLELCHTCFILVQDQINFSVFQPKTNEYNRN